MMQQFPIFVDLHVVPPLIIGDAPALAAKVRSLRKAARRVDVVASENSQWRSEFATDVGVSWLGEIDRQAAKVAIKGRPLVILDCEDESLNRFLFATARAYRMPVNVPDNRELSGFYPCPAVTHGLSFFRADYRHWPCDCRTDRLFAAVRLYPYGDQTGGPQALATGASGDPPPFPAYAEQPAVAARITSPAAGSFAGIAMADFGPMVGNKSSPPLFFYKFFGCVS